MKKLILIVFCLFSFGVFAQEIAHIDVTKINKQLDLIENNINQGKSSADYLTEQLKNINAIQADINQAKIQYQQKRENVQKKIDALGELPQDATSQNSDIADKRKEFVAQEDMHKAQIAQIDLINTKIDEINALILKVRNQSLLNKILIRDASVFQVGNLKNSVLQLSIFSYNILKTPYDWYTNLASSDKQIVDKNIWLVTTIFTLILFFAFYLSLYIRKKFGYKQCLDAPSYMQKIRSNIAMIIAFGIIPTIVFGAFLLWLNANPIVLGNNFGLLLQLATKYLLIFFIIRAAVKVIFVPKCAYWRIIKIDDYKAKTASRTVLFWSLIALATEFFYHLALKQNALTEVIYILQIITVVAKSLGIIFISRSILHNTADDIEPDVQKPEYHLSMEAKISLFITIMMFLTIIVALVGYVRLADYVVNCFILSIATIVAFQSINLLLRYIIRQFLKLKFLTQKLHINPRTLIKTEFWITLLLNPIVWIVAIITILGIWGFSVDIMLHDIKNFLLGFNIGGMHISITSALTGLLSFFVSMFLFKSLKQSLLYGNLSKIDMEQGSRSSLASSISLIGFIVSVIVAVTVMGGSLSNITLIAGALSFGIGLGLQNIVNNFVSGIIIIFEKPIKIGDWVIIKGQEGIVKTISMRATLLEAFDKSNIIIPNSEILSSSLVNRTYSARVGLIEISLNIKYDADIKYLEDTLIEIASKTMGVLTTPAPTVSFADMTEKYLIFKLNCYTENIYSRQTITNLLRTKILQEFKQNNVLWIG
ncbi:MAG: mechanosensitive ion channel [Alphaproteobacteria bacterium]|nr:mechanosensitive ion channel [Alphaproteobacteria bacterium]